MLKTFDLRGRERPLERLRPARAAGAARRAAPGHRAASATRSRSRSSTRTTRSRFDGYAIASFPVEHRVSAYGYAFVEDDRPGRFDAETAGGSGVPPGPDFGRLQRGETVDGVRPEQVMGAPRRGRRIVISGDTAPCQAVEVFAHEADLLVHEATFLRGRARARARDRPLDRAPGGRGRRATPRCACSRSPTSPRATSRARSATRRAPSSRTRVVPRDFDAIEVPFPERGEPHLVKEDTPAPT